MDDTLCTPLSLLAPGPLRSGLLFYLDLDINLFLWCRECNSSRLFGLDVLDLHLFIFTLDHDNFLLDRDIDLLCSRESVRERTQIGGKEYTVSPPSLLSPELAEMVPNRVVGCFIQGLL